MSETRFNPGNLGPAATLGWNEPGVQEYVALGMRTRKSRSIETVLVMIGSARRVADSIGQTMPFVEMSAKRVRALFVEIGKRDNPRPYAVILRSLLGYRAKIAEDDAEQRRFERLRDLIVVPPMKESKIGPGDVLTINEINRLMDAATNMRDRVLVATLYESGGRVSELLSLNIESLTRHQNGGNGGHPWFEAWVSKMKEEGTEHSVYLREKATVELLDRWLASYPSEIVARPRPLVPSLSSAANAEQRLNADSVGDLLDDLADDAGIERHVHAHLFRHTRATMLLREGLSEAVIKKLMGWKPGSPMLARYGHLVSTDVEAALGLTAKDEGEKAELRVPEREVPAMPTIPFPANSAAARRLADLERKMDALTAAKPEVGTIADLRERMNLASKITEAEWDAMSPAEQNVAALEQERDEMRERMAAMERTLAALLKKEA